MNRLILLAASSLSIAAAMFGETGASAQISSAGCSGLTALRFPDVRIVNTTEIRSDPVWQSPAIGRDVHAAPVTKPFCRVEGTIEDEIGFELWLPAKADWNGRFLGSGNGGFAGFFRYEELARGVNLGFAAVSTDTGHKETEVSWSIGKPRRLENYGHRAQHLVAVNAKKIIAAFYGGGPHHSYFLGCSGGGMQAMNEVQRYPNDYDGIVAGAHGQSMVGISARWLSDALFARKHPEAAVTAGQWQKIAAAAVKACDGLDGVRDGLITDPMVCRFDIGSTPGLSPAQIAAARTTHAPILARDGRVLFPGYAPGAGFNPLPSPGGPGEVFAQWLYQDANWDFTRFDPARDIPLMEGNVPGLAINNPNLEAFWARGGKMIGYHGWNDPIVPAQSTIDYYENVRRYMGAQRTDSFYKLYLPAGMEHCSGGPGPSSFGQWFAQDPIPHDPKHDMLQAIVAWVEHGQAPETLIASKFEGGKLTMTRPICPYPQVPRYKGKGDTNDAANFTCAKP